MPIYSPQTGNPFEDATEVSSVEQQDFVLLNDGSDDLQKSAIANLPFASTAHGHEIDEITGLEIALSDKATINHGHPITDIDGLVSALYDKADSNALAATASSLQNQIDAKANAVHSHIIGDIGGLQTTLDSKASSTDVSNLQTQINGKAAVTHTHQISDVNNLQTALDGKASSTDVNNLQTAIANKAPLVHSHQISDVTNLQTSLDAKANSSDVATTVSVLETAIGGKAPSVHGHPISAISNLQTALDGKANVGAGGFDYDQQSVPSGATTGKTWRERDSNNWIVRDWFFDGTDWLSIQEFFQFMGILNGQSNIVTSVSSSTATDNFHVQYNVPLYLHKNAKGVFFTETCLHISSQTPNDANNYWRFRPAFIQTGTATDLGGEYLTTDIAPFTNIEKWITHGLRVYRQPTLNAALNGLRMKMRSFGSPGQMNWCSNTAYRLIR